MSGIMCESSCLELIEEDSSPFVSLKSATHADTSEHSTLYKTPGTKNTQVDRRIALLKYVKERRNATIDEKRGIAELFSTDDSTVEEEPMEVVPIPKKTRRKYANKLMLSEYLFERPDDLETCWLFKCCPKGSRNIVVAHKGITKSFNKAGIFLTEFQSKLPGGNFSMMASKFTILDCIFNADLSTYFVLDILAWNSYSLLNCSTEFRFFFLTSKLEENVSLQTRSGDNKYSFVNTLSQPAELPLIENCIAGPPCDIPPLDGILFYHSEVDYRAGVTPLVGWLEPYMIPEIIHIPVHPDFQRLRPADYTNLAEHAEKQSKQRRKQKKRIHDVQMIEIVDNMS